MNLVRKIKWAAVRIAIYFGIAASVVTLGALPYVLAPATSYVFFGDIRFWKYIGRFRDMILSFVRLMRMFVSAGRTGYCIIIPIFEPPMLGPDKGLVSVSDDWPHGAGHCGGCHTCCDKLGCALVKEDGNCLCYGSLYWRYFNCGRFPENREQLKFYECPKWVI